MYYIVDDDAINELYNGNKWKNTFTGMEQMCKDIDKVLGEEVYLPLKKRYYKDMCDYTHTGIIQMSCNFNEEKGTIEPNFSNHLVVNTLSGIYALTRLFAIAFFENISLTKGFITHRQIDNFIEST